MHTEVLATRRAEQQIVALRRRAAKVFDQFVDDLAARGCAALAYRLSGPTPVDQLCVKHLIGSFRVIVAFETPKRAWILLVAPHQERDPILNVYAELYRLVGIDTPDSTRRTKPPCCDQTPERPPLLGAALADILDQAAQLRKTRRAASA
jgi:hypothetical protein